MPLTPFHFGPGGALHVLAPKRVSFLAFCACNVFIDVEPLYYILTRQYPLHRFFHTYIGATLMAGFTVLFFMGAIKAANPLRLSSVFDWRDLTVLPVVVGAALGAWSHVVLDSIMHPDVRPFAPFSDANPLLLVVSLPALHLFCVITGIAALGIIGVKWIAKRS
jgi:membrane-bound metal-dependent hydrolase YbcI (DUF457 family)